MNCAGTATEPWGLVMAGGESRRMGADKALLLRPDGQTWLEHATGLLGGICGSVWVSARSDQGLEPPEGVGVICDSYQDIGPAAGLLSAWDRFPERPWLVLAADMPWVSSDLLRRLLGARDPKAAATAFRHSGDVAEPLCTLWEPEARAALQRSVTAGNASLTALLRTSPVNWLAIDDPKQLASANTPAQRDRLTN